MLEILKKREAELIEKFESLEEDSREANILRAVIEEVQHLILEAYKLKDLK